MSEGKNLNVVIVMTSPQLRGAEVFSTNLAAELRRRGHLCTTVALYRRAPDTAGLVVDDALGAHGGSILERFPRFQPGVLRNLLARVDLTAPDFVLAVGGRAAKYGALLRWLRPRDPWRLVYRNIGDPVAWAGSALHRWFFRKVVLSRLDGIVTLSPAAERQLHLLYRPRAPLAVIPTGVDTGRLRTTTSRADVRAELGTAPDVPVVVMVGSLSVEKRLDVALRAFVAARLERPDLTLWVIGDGPLRRCLEAQAAMPGAGNRVRFVGATEDVAAYLQAADLLLLTSDTEGTPGVVLEAGAMSLPVVSTRVGGVEECVREGETGLLVDAGDEPGIARALVALAGDSPLRKRLGRAAREWVESRFSISVIASSYERFFEGLTDGH